MVATFHQIDVVQRAPLLDRESFLNKPAQAISRVTKDLESETDLFLSTIIPAFLATLGKQPLRIVGGLLGLFLERNDLPKLAQTKPGIAFLTLFMSRAELLKQNVQAGEGAPEVPAPSEQEVQHW